jgi:hypothetical protein
MIAHATDSTDASTEFMLKEYERLSQMKTEDDRQAEQRVSYFLALTTAGIATIAILLEVSGLPTGILITVAQVALIALFLYGVVIINRIAARSVMHEGLFRLQAKIREYFGHNNAEITAYIDLHRELLARPAPSSKMSLALRRWLRGSLTSLMILSNSIVCGAFVLVTLFAENYPPYAVIIWTISALVLSAVLLGVYYFLIRGFIVPFAI